MFHSMRLISLTIGAAAWLMASPLLAQTLPRSMVELARQSDFIGDVQVGPAKDGKVQVKVIESLKGKPQKAELALDLAAGERKEQREEIERWLADYPPTSGVLFSGKYTYVNGTLVETGKDIVETFTGAFLHIEILSKVVDGIVIRRRL